MKRIVYIFCAALLLTACEKEDESALITNSSSGASTTTATFSTATETVPDPAGTITMNMAYGHTYYLGNNISIGLGEDNNFTGGTWGCVGAVGGLGAITTIPSTMGWASCVAATLGNGYIVTNTYYGEQTILRIFVVGMGSSGVRIKYNTLP